VERWKKVIFGATKSKTRNRFLFLSSRGFPYLQTFPFRFLHNFTRFWLAAAIRARNLLWEREKLLRVCTRDKIPRSCSRSRCISRVAPPTTALAVQIKYIIAAQLSAFAGWPRQLASASEWWSSEREQTSGSRARWRTIAKQSALCCLRPGRKCLIRERNEISLFVVRTQRASCGEEIHSAAAQDKTPLLGIRAAFFFYTPAASVRNEYIQKSEKIAQNQNWRLQSGCALSARHFYESHYSPLISGAAQTNKPSANHRSSAGACFSLHLPPTPSLSSCKWSTSCRFEPRFHPPAQAEKKTPNERVPQKPMWQVAISLACVRSILTLQAPLFFHTPTPTSKAGVGISCFSQLSWTRNF